MIIDPIPTTTSWELHTDPNQVGGQSAPLACGTVELPDAVGFYTQGVPNKYCNWLAAVHRPILKTPTELALAFDVTFGLTGSLFAQAYEWDTILTQHGLKSNCSFQAVPQSKGWSLQISGADGNWVDTGFLIPPLVSEVLHHFQFTYQFGTLYGMTAINIDDQLYMIPPKFLLKPIPTNWSDTLTTQVQQNTNLKGGSLSHKMSGIRYLWS